MYKQLDFLRVSSEMANLSKAFNCRFVKHKEETLDGCNLRDGLR
jgi:hypothetical protein